MGVVRSLARGCYLACLIFTINLTGCQSLSRYESRLSDVSEALSQGNLEKAIDAHGYLSSNDDTLLYHLELGELYWLQGDYEQALRSWLIANKIVASWESLARLDSSLVIQDVGSVLINDKIKTYQGYDFEKVMLASRIALTHLMMKDMPSARVAIKATHEREAVIENFRSRQRQHLQAEQTEKNYSLLDFPDYPADTLESTDISNLRNSYENALSHYLAGFVYEQLGEPSLAAPGYRKAAELRPKALDLLPGAKTLNTRMSRAKVDDSTDLLVIFEHGLAPVKKSIEIALLIGQGGDATYVPFSAPAYNAPQVTEDVGLTMRESSLQFSSDVVDIDAMSRRALKDEMPTIIARGILRSGVKVAMQNAADELDDSGLMGGLIGLAGVVTELADDRSWRLLPRNIGIARQLITRGTRTLELRSGSRSHSLEVLVTGRFMLLFVRQVGSQWYVNQVSFN